MDVCLPSSAPVSTTVCQGPGWIAESVCCNAGPADRPFEERHERASIAVVLGGMFTYRSEHGRDVMSAGSVLLGNPGTCFECGHEHSRGDHCLALHIDPDALEEMAGQIDGCRSARFRAGRLPPHPATVSLLSAAQALLTDPSALLGQELAFDLVRRGLLGAPSDDAPPANSRDEGRVADVLHFIEHHLSDGLSLETLAKVAGSGRFQLLRSFRRVVGQTPYAYILQRRLQVAAERLRGTPSRITDLALDSGFGDISEFTRHFARRYGCTPGAYRNRHARAQSVSEPAIGHPAAAAPPLR